MNASLLLIGLRGAGKTTVGELVAARLRVPFIDLDERVLKALNAASVTAVWQSLGEAAWRSKESEALQEVLDAVPCVIALGGGTPEVPSAHEAVGRARADRRAYVVYLHCAIAELGRRLESQPGDRPPLTATTPQDEIATISARRDPIYRGLADWTLDVTALTAAKARDAIVAQLSAAGMR